MKNITYLFAFLALTFSASLDSQSTIKPSSISTGTETTVTFSGSPISMTNGTCIEVRFKSGTQVIYQTASAIYYQASNTLVASFYLASNTLTGLYDVILFDFCNNKTIATYAKKMSISISSIIKSIRTFFSIFPNPVQRGEDINILNEEVIAKLNTLSVYDLSGKLIYSKPVVKQNETISTDNISPGIYFIQIINENGNKLSKKIEVKEFIPEIYFGWFFQYFITCFYWLIPYTQVQV